MKYLFSMLVVAVALVLVGWAAPHNHDPPSDEVASVDRDAPMGDTSHDGKYDYYGDQAIEPRARDGTIDDPRGVVATNLTERRPTPAPCANDSPNRAARLYSFLVSRTGTKGVSTT